MTNLSDSNKRCVYATPEGLCNGESPLDPREHYFSRGLGEFKGDSRLSNVICTACNKRFGKLEDVLLHNSPEAFFREMLGTFGRSSRGRKKGIFYEPTAGVSPLSILAKQPGVDHPMLWQLMSATHIAAMKQVIFKDEDGKYFHLPFRPEKFTEVEVKKLLAGATPPLNKPVLVGYLANDDEARQIEDVCKEFIKGKTTISDLTVGDELDCTMWAPISIPYMRAIAKIGFHFFLKWFPQFTGTEPELEDIKRFIYQGGADCAQFVEPIAEPIVKFPPEKRVLMWGHLVNCQYDYATVEARIQFFVGPMQVQPIVWRVKIGKSPARLHAKAYKCLHFRYYQDKTDGYDGQIVELDRRLIVER